MPPRQRERLAVRVIAHVIRQSYPSVPLPKFARLVGTLSCELRNQRALQIYNSSSLRKNPSPTQEFADSFFSDESAEGKMRGGFVDQGRLFSYISPEARVPANHPLRAIRALVRDVLTELDRSLWRLYASEGRHSIPPEQLLSALLLQVFYGIRSERQLMEQLDYNLLYRWF